MKMRNYKIALALVAIVFLISLVAMNVGPWKKQPSANIGEGTPSQKKEYPRGEWRREIQEGNYEGSVPSAPVGEPILAFNDSDLREVAGYFDDVFVGQVAEYVETRNISGMVFTHYRVKVMSGLKGDLSGTIGLAQQGGIQGDSWANFNPKGSGTISKTKQEYLSNEKALKIGGVYLFSTLRNAKLDTNLLGPTQASFKLLNVDTSKDEASMAVEAKKTSEVVEMEAAVANPIEKRRK